MRAGVLWRLSGTRPGQRIRDSARTVRRRPQCGARPEFFWVWHSRYPPLSVTIRRCSRGVGVRVGVKNGSPLSSILGRAIASQAMGRGFESRLPLQEPPGQAWRLFSEILQSNCYGTTPKSAKRDGIEPKFIRSWRDMDRHADGPAMRLCATRCDRPSGDRPSGKKVRLPDGHRKGRLVCHGDEDGQVARSSFRVGVGTSRHFFGRSKARSNGAISSMSTEACSRYLLK